MVDPIFMSKDYETSDELTSGFSWSRYRRVEKHRVFISYVMERLLKHHAVYDLIVN